MLKLWYSLCLIFLTYGLILFLESDKTLHLKKSHEKFPFKFSVCFKPEIPIDKNIEFVTVCDVIDNFYNQLEKNLLLKSNHMRNYRIELNTTFEKINKERLSKLLDQGRNYEDSYEFFLRDLKHYVHGMKSVKDLLRKEKSYIIKELVCFMIDEEFLDYLPVFNDFTYKLYSISYLPTYESNCLIFDHKLKSRSGLRIFKTYIWRCPNLKTTLPTESLYECLNECLLQKEEKIIYMYNYSYEEKINVTNKNRDLDLERSCFEDCTRKSCYFESSLIVNVLANVQKEITVFESYYTNTFFDKLFQILSLLFLVINISLYSLLVKLNRALNVLLSKTSKNRKSAKRYILKKKFTKLFFSRIKLLIFLMCLILLMATSYISIKNCFNSSKNPIVNEATTFSVLPEKLDVIICIPIRLNISRKNDFVIEKGEDLYKYSFQEIENYTNSDLDIILENAFLKKGSTSNVLDLKPSRKVYFKKSKFNRLGLSVFSRCFRIGFELEIILYQDLQITSDIILKLNEKCYVEYEFLTDFYDFKFTQNLCEIYLLDKSASFTSKTFMHENNFEINKRKIKRFRSFLQINCIDYDDLKLSCTSCQNCIEKCINLGFLEKFNSITTESETIIDKDEFVGKPLSLIYFNETYDPKTINECKEKFVHNDCAEVYFIESYRKMRDHKKHIKINLNHETIEDKETEMSIQKLLLDIMNLEILFFGSNMSGLLIYVSYLIKSIIRINEKLIKYFISVFCFAGFLIQSIMIFNTIIKAPLINVGDHIVQKNFRYPDLNFCFDYDANNDPNFKLTANYLESLTSHLTFEKIFKNITYVNNEDELVDLYQYHRYRKKKSSHNLDQHILVPPYFIQTRKCFHITVKEMHENHEFYFRKDSFPLKINFNKKTIKTLDKFYLKSTFWSNQEKNYVFEIQGNRKGIKKQKHQIRTEMLEIITFDQFKNVFKTLGIIFGFFERKTFFEIMKEEVEKNDLYTFNLPIEWEDFDKEIEDDLFNQMYLQTKKFQDRSYADDSYRFFVSNYITSFDLDRNSEMLEKEEQQFDLEFSPIFLRKYTIFTNGEGLTKLTISILNVLSLWLNVCVLDLHQYIPYLFYLLIWLNVIFREKLIAIQIYLWQRMN